MFCGKCGAAINPDARFCSACGAQINGSPANSPAADGSLMKQLNTKLWAEIIAWCVVVLFQVIVSLFLFSQGGSDNVFSGIICAVCAVLNIGSVYDDYTFLNQIKNRPAGIVDRYESMPDFWFAFLWSVTKGMGVGLIAWIFTMLTRSFVLDNRQSFLELENNVKN